MSEANQLSDAQILNHRDMAIGQMRFARSYTLGMLESIAGELWNVIPPGAPSNIAWQVGHLAVAQYGLMLFRQRGRAEGDIELMPGWLRKNFGKGTQPSAALEVTPSHEELLAILDNIHQRSLVDADTYSAASLAEPAEMPFAVYPMKLGALMFAPLHESIHIGQIGMIRRLLGLAPVR
jgi:hypothetical protein